MRLTLITTLLLIACWNSASASPSADLSPAQQHAVRALFDYDRNKLPVLTQLSSVFLDGLQVLDVEFAATSAERARVKVYVINPEARGTVAAGKYAGILYFHWLGRIATVRNSLTKHAAWQSAMRLRCCSKAISLGSCRPRMARQTDGA